MLSSFLRTSSPEPALSEPLSQASPLSQAPLSQAPLSQAPLCAGSFVTSAFVASPLSAPCHKRFVHPCRTTFDPQHLPSLPQHSPALHSLLAQADLSHLPALQSLFAHSALADALQVPSLQHSPSFPQQSPALAVLSQPLSSHLAEVLQVPSLQHSPSFPQQSLALAVLSQPLSSHLADALQVPSLQHSPSLPQQSAFFVTHGTFGMRIVLAMAVTVVVSFLSRSACLESGSAGISRAARRSRVLGSRGSLDWFHLKLQERLR